MTTFANVSDVELRWRPLSAEEGSRVGVLLEDASALIRATNPAIDARITAGTMDPAVPCMVAVAVVKRAMIGGDDTAGVNSQMNVAGPFSQQITYANPSGDLYLTRAEKRLIGQRHQRAGMVDMSQPVQS